MESAIVTTQMDTKMSLIRVPKVCVPRTFTTIAEAKNAYQNEVNGSSKQFHARSAWNSLVEHEVSRAKTFQEVSVLLGNVLSGSEAEHAMLMRMVKLSSTISESKECYLLAHERGDIEASMEALRKWDTLAFELALHAENFDEAELACQSSGWKGSPAHRLAIQKWIAFSDSIERIQRILKMTLIGSSEETEACRKLSLLIMEKVVRAETVEELQAVLGAILPGSTEQRFTLRKLRKLQKQG